MQPTSPGQNPLLHIVCWQLQLLVSSAFNSFVVLHLTVPVTAVAPCGLHAPHIVLAVSW